MTAASICPIATARFAPPARVFRNGSCRSFVGPDEGAGEGDRCLVAGGVFVVAGGDASPLLETVEASFDDVAAPVGGLVEYTGPFRAPGQARELVDTLRDGGLDAAPLEVGAEGPGGVARVRDDPLGPQAGSSRPVARDADEAESPYPTPATTAPTTPWAPQTPTRCTPSPSTATSHKSRWPRNRRAPPRERYLPRGGGVAGQCSARRTPSSPFSSSLIPAANQTDSRPPDLSVPRCSPHRPGISIGLPSRSSRCPLSLPV